jgi:hypothetical protein
MMGGEEAVATVTLTIAAGSGGTTVQLSSSNDAVTLPPSAVVPAGAVTVMVPVATRAVAVDTPVVLRATAAGRTVEETIDVWAVLPTFFSFHSDLGEFVGQGGTMRLVPGAAQFAALCDGNRIRVDIDRGRWSTEFSGAAGTRLRVGAYEDAAESPFAGTRPGMRVGGDGRGCGRVAGRFVVREIDLSPTGEVRQFWVTFDQRCENGTGHLVGDIRVTAPPVIQTPFTQSCVR